MDLDIVHDYGIYREEKGKQEEKIEIATNMLNKGYTTEQIAEVTKLDANSIEQLNINNKEN